jgi:tetratricopeptide (TPR) repeat protein
MRDAAEAYLQEIKISPHHLKALFNLSRLYRLAGDENHELEYLRKAVEANPRFPMSYLYIARIYLNRGANYQEAITMAKKGLDLGPDKSDLALAYFLLADLYNRVGDNARSQEYAEKGQAVAAALKNGK